MSERPLLDPTSLPANVKESMSAFHGDIVEEVRKTVAERPLVVVGMAQNPFVKKARKALSNADLPFEYLEYGSYFGQWKERLAIKMWSGWPTFPQVYVRGVLIGGFNETEAALADGSLKERLEA